ncbi:MAG: glycosyltransferase [Acidimicrobiia bacterium]
MSDAPDDVVRRAQERVEARHRRDFAAADRLRDEITAAGWQVIDGADGFDLVPLPVRRVASVIADAKSWAEDWDRFLASLTRQAPSPEAVQIIGLEPGLGFAADRNAALGQADAEIVVFFDTSLEVTGDLLGVLAGALQDPAVAVAGPYGLVSADLHDYEERTEGDVAAIQGYCLAARWDDLKAVGGFRESFAFYRNADIDLSLRLRTHGPEVRRAVAVGAEHCRRHAHRDWEETDPTERDRLSRKNMSRILDRFAGRAGELTVA